MLGLGHIYVAEKVLDRGIVVVERPALMVYSSLVPDVLPLNPRISKKDSHDFNILDRLRENGPVELLYGILTHFYADDIGNYGMIRPTSEQKSVNLNGGYIYQKAAQRYEGNESLVDKISSFSHDRLLTEPEARERAATMVKIAVDVLLYANYQNHALTGKILDVIGALRENYGELANALSYAYALPKPEIEAALNIELSAFRNKDDLVKNLSMTGRINKLFLRKFKEYSDGSYDLQHIFRLLDFAISLVQRDHTAFLDHVVDEIIKRGL